MTNRVKWFDPNQAQVDLNDYIWGHVWTIRIDKTIWTVKVREQNVEFWKKKNEMFFSQPARGEIWQVALWDVGSSGRWRASLTCCVAKRKLACRMVKSNRAISAWGYLADFTTSPASTQHSSSNGGDHEQSLGNPNPNPEPIIRALPMWCEAPATAATRALLSKG
jgi:hypothetical protein